MKPILFDEANRTLEAPSKRSYSANVKGISGLPVWTDGEQCVSCWRPSLRERLMLLLFGRIWVSVLSGYSQPPISIQATPRYFEELPETEL